MKLVLLSGGSGKRLWPLSNDVRSKQFLRVLQNEQGDMVSMLERVWSQLADLDAQDGAYVCASHAQTDIIYSQLGDVSVIVEPLRMDTFPAIALATLYLSQDTLVDEVVAVAPVDQYVDKAFFKAILDLPRTLDDSGADLALLGVRPLCPSSQFGYIRVEQAGGQAPYRRVDAFTEKPDRDRAAQLVAEGALWNCGVFCFRASYLINLLRERGYPTTYRNMVEQFDQMPLRSFDYEVLESSESIVVTPYDGAWKDMGTWPVLAPELKNDFIGRGVAE
ncbi:MAG: sugar phosphate nucleotidyltransferase, partial [Actinomycetes bacterium]